MNNEENRSSDTETPVGQEEAKLTPTSGKRKVSKWIKIPAWIIGCVLMLVLIIPVLLYIPPIQTAVKDLACVIVKDKTGMNVEIDLFRLKFPLDIDLKGVKVIEASGDTMVRVQDDIARVKLLPLLG